MKPAFRHEAYRIDSHGRKTSRWPITQGIASESIHHIPLLLARVGRLPIVLYCRVSTDDQQKHGNLRDEEVEAIQQLSMLRYELGINLFVLSGVETSNVRGERPLLVEAIALAKSRGAILVAPSRDRFIRWGHFTRGVPDELEPPTIVEYLLLQDLAGTVPLATILPPDAPEARSTQIKRGHKAKGRKGGRGKKAMSSPEPPEGKREWKKRREARIEFARQERDAGLSYQQITDELNAIADGFPAQTKMTVWNWLNGGV